MTRSLAVYAETPGCAVKYWCTLGVSGGQPGGLLPFQCNSWPRDGSGRLALPASRRRIVGNLGLPGQVDDLGVALPADDDGRQ